MLWLFFACCVTALYFARAVRAVKLLLSRRRDRARVSLK